MAGVPSVGARKGAEPLVMVTAYDTPTAAIADAAGVDLILVGDSVGTAVLGYEDTLSVTLDDMVHHTSAVARARPSALVVADLPWLTYHVGPVEAVLAAGRLVRAGARAVKLEGGRKRLEVIAALVDAEIPVMGHLGLTPQSVNVMGGYKVQAREAGSEECLVADACALAGAGCFAIVLECIPGEVAARVTATVPVPIIGIGAGARCDGQVLVWHDLVGITDRTAKFVKRYAETGTQWVDAVSGWAADVRARRFPSEAETYHGRRESPAKQSQGCS